MISHEEMLRMHRERRSIRKFHEEKEIPPGVLERIVEAGRYAPISCNAHAIDYVIVKSMKAKQRIFPWLTFAHHVESMNPRKGERPSVYVLTVMNSEVIEQIVNKFMEKYSNDYAVRARRSFDVSYGMVLQMMISQALVEGVSSCPIAGINEEQIKREFSINQKDQILAALALGYSRDDQKPEVRVVPNGSSTKYFIEDGKLIVPKVLPTVRYQ